uniref:Uncharacterized protein n=1 Tax=Arundo donax TaxID=35708 RepID=A0A0A9BBC2_ARUDO
MASTLLAGNGRRGRTSCCFRM